MFAHNQEYADETLRYFLMKRIKGKDADGLLIITDAVNIEFDQGNPKIQDFGMVDVLEVHTTELIPEKE